MVLQKKKFLEKTGHTVGLDNVSLNMKKEKLLFVWVYQVLENLHLIRHINRLIDPTDGEL